MKCARPGFVLLDVILSIMILAVVVVTAMRSFTQSIHAVRTSEIVARASMYAEAKLHELELTPPEDRGGKLSGSFADEDIYSEEELFPDAVNYRWEAELDEEEIRYPRVRLPERNQEQMKQLTHVMLRVYYDDGEGRDATWVPVVIDTYLPVNERFSAAARQAMGLF